LSLALWNGSDPILKERLFGVTNAEGNHGETVKEHYFYLDATPSHSYLKMLYKYPQRAFPYTDLVAENGRRGTDVPEYELLIRACSPTTATSTSSVEYAQAEPGDILMKITAWNRGGAPAVLHMIPQLVLRNTWTWEPGSVKPRLRAIGDGAVAIAPAALGVSRCTSTVTRICCSPRTNRILSGSGTSATRATTRTAFTNASSAARRPGESIPHRHQGRRLVSIDHRGGQAGVSPAAVAAGHPRALRRIDECMTERRAEADQYYADLQKDIDSADERVVQRQAFAGLIWSKQFLQLGHSALAQGRSRRTDAAGVARCTAAMSNGAISTMPTSFPCRTNGSIPGTPPGIWPSIASPSP